jgi:hypothetical protein
MLLKLLLSKNNLQNEDNSDEKHSKLRHSIALEAAHKAMQKLKLQSLLSSGHKFQSDEKQMLKKFYDHFYMKLSSNKEQENEQSDIYDENNHLNDELDASLRSIYHKNQHYDGLNNLRINSLRDDSLKGLKKDSGEDLFGQNEETIKEFERFSGNF